MIGGENGSGDLPNGVGLLELNEPLIGSDAVAGLGIVIQDMNRLGYFHLQVHFFFFI
jgi:hypothetical protein